MVDYRLHGMAESGNTYKVALMLELIGASWEPVFVDFFGGAHRSEEFLKINPMGEVPVLEGPQGVQTQSGVILTSLAREYEKLGGMTSAEDDEILRWILWDNHKMTAYFASYRFMTRFLPEPKRDQNVIAFLNSRRIIATKVLERRLAEQDWVALGDRPTIADLSICGYFFFLDEIGESREDWPAIGRWLERLEALPGWRHPYDLLPRSPSIS